MKLVDFAGCMRPPMGHMWESVLCASYLKGVPVPSALSPAFPVTTPEPLVLVTPPRCLTANRTQQGVLLSWLPPANHSFPIDRYIMEFRVAERWEVLDDGIPGTDNEFFAKDLSQVSRGCPHHTSGVVCCSAGEVGGWLGPRAWHFKELGKAGGCGGGPDGCAWCFRTPGTSSGSWRSCRISSANPATLLACPVQVRGGSFCPQLWGHLCFCRC